MNAASSIGRGMTSFWTRFAQDATHSVQDVYSHWVLGDDTGKSAVFTWLCDAEMDDLGLRFIEIHGRAYVKSVTSGSPAATAGIQPQDAIQLCIEVTGNHAVKYALDLEAKGNRITYDQLYRLLQFSPQLFLSPPIDVDYSNHIQRWNGPPIPSTICAPILVPADGSSSSDASDADRPRHRSTAASHHHQQPLLFVFRRTQQRHHAVALSFRLDDECDLACSLVRRLAPTTDAATNESMMMMSDSDSLLLESSYSKRNGEGSTVSLSNLDDGVDVFERQRMEKMGQLRAKMTAQAMEVGRNDEVEAATIRGMIQKAVGLAFVRASKVVMGVSVHGGSGIVISRLPDGTWSAPSAVGTWGLGLGLQFGLEVAEYIFILQTQEALQHFRKGDSYTVGGNLGMAVGAMGREAYGAASLEGTCNNDTTVQLDDEYNDEERPSQRKLAIAPIVAYAKSQGLYFGVSLEGSRIFTRSDVNSRTYKFSCGRDVTANDILSGKVPTPPEAEDLYAALHSIEFAHEMSCLPRPPEVLRHDSFHPWNYDSGQDMFSFFARMTEEENNECVAFEAQFKNFMYGGVSVQRLIPDADGGKTSKERRTLWLMLPEVGSLRLGFVSKLSDGEGQVSNKSSTQRATQNDDTITVASEDVTLDSAIQTRDGSTIGAIRTGNVQLSDKHSMALTDITVLSQDPLVPIKLNGEKTQHLRIISIQDVSGGGLHLLANNFREAELLFCGLKLLLERETDRLGVRGGLPITALGGRKNDESMSPTAARGFREAPLTSPEGNSAQWSKLPGRNFMRGQAFGFNEEEFVDQSLGVPHYVHGKPLSRHLARLVRLELPLGVCRVLLLDSTSPVIDRWEEDRGDKNFAKSPWSFPPGTPREREKYEDEHDLISAGSMKGANRTCSFDRPRYGSLVRLTETHAVEADNPKSVTVTITERNPRRGFSLKIKVHLTAEHDHECIASVVADIRPVGKDMSNQAAVHKAFGLVVEELKARYGTEGVGLMAGFLAVIAQFHESKKSPKRSQPQPIGAGQDNLNRIDSGGNESGLVSFEDMLKTGRESPVSAAPRPVTPSLQLHTPEANPGARLSAAKKKMPPPKNDKLLAGKLPQQGKKDHLLVEVKPLPKIRLSLMPSPREEDEYKSSDESDGKGRKKKHHKKKRGSPNKARRKMLTADDFGEV